MNVLAVETSQSACGVAVRVGGRLAAARSVVAERGHAELLLPLVAECLDEAEIGYSGLTLLAATVGPGMFTGVRAGLAAVRGLRLVLRVPAVGIGTLSAIAASAYAGSGIDPSARVMVAVDARRNEIYLQSFEPAAGPESFFDGIPELLPIGAAAARVTRDTVLIGSGAGLVAAVAGLPARVLAGLGLPLASVVAELAERSAAAPGFVDPGPPRPLYVRGPHVGA